MKTEEDEAFDDLAKRQGSWGGGFTAKRKMAADKLWDKPSVAFDEWWNGDNDESTNPFRLESGAYWAWAGWKAALAQPAREVDYWIREATAARQAEMALRRELDEAQSAQEPVAWRWGIKKLNGGYEWRYTLNKTRPDSIPLYAAPQKRNT
jgi:hypothetical protein